MTWINGRWVDTPQYGSEAGYDPDEQEDTMTYIPKHRGEPVIKYRVHYIERERGWAPDEWDTDYDTEEMARALVAETNERKPGPVPDVYVTAYYIGEVQL